MVAEAEKMRDCYGITTFKVKVGRRPVGLDVAVVRALREHLGTPSNSTSTATAAGRPRSRARAMNRWQSSTYCSPRSSARPTMYWAAAGWSPGSTCRSSPTNRSHPGRRDPRGARRVGHAVSIKTARTGFTGSQRVHHLAEGLGLEVVWATRSTASSVRLLGRLRRGVSAHLAARRRVSNFLDMSDDLLAEPLDIHGGNSSSAPAPVWALRSTQTSSPATAPTDKTRGPDNQMTADTPAEQASAAASGASATARFVTDKAAFAAEDTPPERVDLLAREVLDAIHATIRRTRSPTPSTTRSKPG